MNKVLIQIASLIFIIFLLCMDSLLAWILAGSIFSIMIDFPKDS